MKWIASGSPLLTKVTRLSPALKGPLMSHLNLSFEGEAAVMVVGVLGNEPPAPPVTLISLMAGGPLPPPGPLAVSRIMYLPACSASVAVPVCPGATAETPPSRCAHGGGPCALS